MGEKKHALQTTRLFWAVPETVLEQISAVMETVTVKAGETVLNKGDVGTAMYVIADGRVRVHDGKWTLNYLGPGEVFGEMAALDSEIRSASITAEVDTTLWQLERQPLYDLMSRYKEVNQGIIHGLCQSLRDRSEDLVADYQHREVLERELEIGREIQASFLPEALPDEAGWEIAAYFRAAREVAGDFYDAFVFESEQRIGLFLGDVCDKGVGAALFMTLFRSLLRAATYSHDFMRHMGLESSNVDDSTRLQNSVLLTNNYIATAHGQTSMFATLFFALLNPATGALTYVNAGHQAPVVLGPGGVKARLRPTAPAIGLFPDVNIGCREMVLEPGETLLVFTDGVTDALNPQGEDLTEERLLSWLGQPGLTAQGLLDMIVDNLTAHIDAASPFDDVTMMAVRRLG